MDPRTGLIRRNDQYRTWRARSRENEDAAAAEVSKRTSRRASRVYDVALKRLVSRDDCWNDRLAKDLYGDDTLDAIAKRQLSKREIEKFALPR